MLVQAGWESVGGAALAEPVAPKARKKSSGMAATSWRWELRLIIVIVFVFFGGGYGPVGIVVIAAAAGVPEDAVEGVFVGAVGVGEVEFKRFFGPMFLLRVVDRFEVGIEFVERNKVRRYIVGRQVGLCLEATRHRRGGGIHLVHWRKTQ